MLQEPLVTVFYVIQGGGEEMGQILFHSGITWCELRNEWVLGKEVSFLISSEFNRIN